MANIGKSIDFLFNQMRAYQGSLAGGSVTFYSPNSTSIVPIYLDINCTIGAANPYLLSADGTAELFGNGTYRIIVKNAQGVIVFDYDYVEIQPTPAPSTGGGGGSSSIGFTVIPCLNSTAAKTLDPLLTLQYITRTGDSQFPLTINPSAGKNIYPGLSPILLYSDGETMGFLYDGTYYYPVVS